MNNTLKILLLNLLLLAPWAVQAMNPLRNFGARISRTVFATATKFKGGVQALKAAKNPLTKAINFAGNNKKTIQKIAIGSTAGGLGVYFLNKSFSPSYTIQKLCNQPDFTEKLTAYLKEAAGRFSENDWKACAAEFENQAQDPQKALQILQILSSLFDSEDWYDWPFWTYSTKNSAKRVYNTLFEKHEVAILAHFLQQDCDIKTATWLLKKMSWSSRNNLIIQTYTEKHADAIGLLPMQELISLLNAMSNSIMMSPSNFPWTSKFATTVLKKCIYNSDFRDRSLFLELFKKCDQEAIIPDCIAADLSLSEAAWLSTYFMSRKALFCESYVKNILAKEPMRIFEGDKVLRVHLNWFFAEPQTVQAFSKILLAHDAPPVKAFEYIHKELPEEDKAAFEDAYYRKFVDPVVKKARETQDITHLFDEPIPEKIFSQEARAIVAGSTLQSHAHVRIAAPSIRVNLYKKLKQLKPLVRSALQLEQKEAEQGRIVLYHGQEWPVHFYTDLYKQLWNKTGAGVPAGEDFTFLRCDQKEKTILDKRYDALWLNNSLFGNPDRMGSCSIDYLIRNSSAEPSQLSVYGLAKQFDLKDHLNDYAEEFDALKKDHHALSQYGNMLLVSMTPKQAQAWKCKSVHAGSGNTKKIRIDQSNGTSIKTADVAAITHALKHDPNSVDLNDAVAFTLPITKEVNNPATGPRIYEINMADPKKYAAYAEQRDLLIGALQLKKLIAEESAMNAPKQQGVA